MHPVEKIAADAWAAFNAWCGEHDPDGEMDLLDQIDAYGKWWDTMEHDLYRTGDKDAPEVIKDSNGEVVLGLCRRCRRAEVELSEPCAPRVTENDRVGD